MLPFNDTQTSVVQTEYLRHRKRLLPLETLSDSKETCNLHLSTSFLHNEVTKKALFIIEPDKRAFNISGFDLYSKSSQTYLEVYTLSVVNHTALPILNRWKVIVKGLVNATRGVVPIRWDTPISVEKMSAQAFYVISKKDCLQCLNVSLPKDEFLLMKSDYLNIRGDPSYFVGDCVMPRLSLHVTLDGSCSISSIVHLISRRERLSLPKSTGIIHNVSVAKKKINQGYIEPRYLNGLISPGKNEISKEHPHFPTFPRWLTHMRKIFHRKRKHQGDEYETIHTLHDGTILTDAKLSKNLRTDLSSSTTNAVVAKYLITRPNFVPTRHQFIPLSDNRLRSNKNIDKKLGQVETLFESLTTTSSDPLPEISKAEETVEPAPAIEEQAFSPTVCKLIPDLCVTTLAPSTLPLNSESPGKDPNATKSPVKSPLNNKLDPTICVLRPELCDESPQPTKKPKRNLTKQPSPSSKYRPPNSSLNPTLCKLIPDACKPSISKRPRLPSRKPSKVPFKSKSPASGVDGDNVNTSMPSILDQKKPVKPPIEDSNSAPPQRKKTSRPVMPRRSKKPSRQVPSSTPVISKNSKEPKNDLKSMIPSIEPSGSSLPTVVFDSNKGSSFPSNTPSDFPSLSSNRTPSNSNIPSEAPSGIPSLLPSGSNSPSISGSSRPSKIPSDSPSSSKARSDLPSSIPSDMPSSIPSGSVYPSLPSISPSGSSSPSTFPSGSFRPSTFPSGSSSPSTFPSGSFRPSTFPSGSSFPSNPPSGSFWPSTFPSGSSSPSTFPSGSFWPSTFPSGSSFPSNPPSGSFWPSTPSSESSFPSLIPSGSSSPSALPSRSLFPSLPLSDLAGPSDIPSDLPSIFLQDSRQIPSGSWWPSTNPSEVLFFSMSDKPSQLPSDEPSLDSSTNLSPSGSHFPSANPSESSPTTLSSMSLLPSISPVLNPSMTNVTSIACKGFVDGEQGTIEQIIGFSYSMQTTSNEPDFIDELESTLLLEVSRFLLKCEVKKNRRALSNVNDTDIYQIGYPSDFSTPKTRLCTPNEATAKSCFIVDSKLAVVSSSGNLQTAKGKVLDAISEVFADGEAIQRVIPNAVSYKFMEENNTSTSEKNGAKSGMSLPLIVTISLIGSVVLMVCAFLAYRVRRKNSAKREKTKQVQQTNDWQNNIYDQVDAFDDDSKYDNERESPDNTFEGKNAYDDIREYKEFNANADEEDERLFLTSQ